MPRSYRHIKQYETEMLKLKEEGLSIREIGNRFGLTRDQTHDFFKRYNRKQRKIEAAKALHAKGQASKSKNHGLPPSILKQDKLAQMRYVMASKDRYIKRLEMENELLRDFLTHTERSLSTYQNICINILAQQRIYCRKTKSKVGYHIYQQNKACVIYQ